MNAPLFPISPLLPQIQRHLAAQPRLVLEAPPGAGKTTQVPLALLAALAGMVFAARLNTATPKAGLGFELDVIEIGQDEDGDPITTCLVRDTDAPAGQKGASRRPASTLDLVMRAVRLCVEDGHVETVVGCPGVPAGTEGVRQQAVRDKLFEIGWPAGEAKPDSIRRTMDRYILSLISDERLRGHGSLVWEV